MYSRITHLRSSFCRDVSTSLKKGYQCAPQIRSYHSKTGYFGYQPVAATTSPEPASATENRNANAAVHRVVSEYRQHAHKGADLDILGLRDQSFTPAYVDAAGPREAEYKLEGLVTIPGKETASLADIVQHLESTYLGKIGLETNHMSCEHEKEWFCTKAEEYTALQIPAEKRAEHCEIMLKSQIFDYFLAKKFPTLKRYSGEGAEVAMTFFHELFELCAGDGVEELVMGMPHRGRLNLLTGMLNYPPAQMFNKIKGNPEFPTDYTFCGDVLSHLYSSTDVEFGANKLHISMVPNPSHLEAQDPVAAGKVRCKQMTKDIGQYSTAGDEHKIVCLQVHGDAAVTAQGVVTELLAMSGLPHFDVGGSIHFICNNQIGFTTPSERGGTFSHVSDVAKSIGCPIIHVNGKHPEEMIKATRLAYDYKKQFGKDVFINMLCFRRYGHNEIDDPTFTQPQMYDKIHALDTIPNMYLDQLKSEGVVDQEKLDASLAAYEDHLNKEMELATSGNYLPQKRAFEGKWSAMEQASSVNTTVWDTGCDIDTLKYVAAKSVELPSDFNLHPNLVKTFKDARIKKATEGTMIDWATAEMMAIGSLLLHGHNVRICGQDVGRGTFSHRHAMITDQTTDEVYIPINNMHDGQTGSIEVCNSLLSEEAVLAFEYGMSIESPNNLCIWEAQFGDFFNGAQIIIDTFICNGETKWMLQSGLVMLLPHGLDGAGPDHSSCKIERFLQLTDSSETYTDSDNVSMQVVNPTTSAQYFHLLRRQQLRNFRKPLVVASPKLILRMSAAASSLDEMAPGTHFLPVIGDKSATPAADVKRVMFCSGKHYFELDKQRRERGVTDTAIVRVESLVPFPAEDIKQELNKFPNATEFTWAQEEHRNQGCWSFVNPRFQSQLGVRLDYAGRDVLACSAIGVGKWHAAEVAQLFNDTFKA